MPSQSDLMYLNECILTLENLKGRNNDNIWYTLKEYVHKKFNICKYKGTFNTNKMVDIY